MGNEHGERLGQRRPVRIAFDEALLVARAIRDERAHAIDALGDELLLLAHVRHDALGGIGRCGGAYIGRQIDERPVVLMADRRDDRRRAGRRGAHHAFVGEPHEVLEAAAAARDDDHVHIRVGVELLDRRDDVRRALLALHMSVHNREPHAGPAQVHVHHHVAFRACLRGADQPDVLRKLRQCHLAALIK